MDGRHHASGHLAYETLNSQGTFTRFRQEHMFTFELYRGMQCPNRLSHLKLVASKLLLKRHVDVYSLTPIRTTAPKHTEHWSDCTSSVQFRFDQEAQRHA